MTGEGLASSAEHHQEDGPTPSLGHVSMGKDQYAVSRGGEGAVAGSRMIPTFMLGGTGRSMPRAKGLDCFTRVRDRRIAAPCHIVMALFQHIVFASVN